MAVSMAVPAMSVAIFVMMRVPQSHLVWFAPFLAAEWPSVPAYMPEIRFMARITLLKQQDTKYHLIVML
jgi:hypothetical protein